MAVLTAVILGAGLLGFQAGRNSDVGWYISIGSWAWTSVGSRIEKANRAMDLGDLDEAEKQLKAVEEFFRANPSDSSTSKSRDAGLYDTREVVHDNLGRLYEQRGDTGHAIEEYEAAVSSCQPNTAACYIYSSHASVLKGKAEDAVQALEKALELEPENFLAHNSLGWVLLKSGDYARALPHNQKAYSLRADPNTTRNLARNYRELGKYADAESVLQNALTSSEKAFGRNHPSVRMYALELAEVYHDDQQKAEAEPLYKLALELAETNDGLESDAVAEILNDFGQFYVLQKKYTEAEPLLKRTLAIRQKIFGQDHENLTSVLSNLTYMYMSAGRNAEALPLLERYLRIAQSTFGPDDDRTRSVAQRVTEVRKLLEAENRK